MDGFAAEPLYKGAAPTITPSIGVALYPSDGHTAGSLHRSADLVLFAAKRIEKNTWRSYVTEMGR